MKNTDTIPELTGTVSSGEWVDGSVTRQELKAYINAGILSPNEVALAERIIKTNHK